MVSLVRRALGSFAITLILLCELAYCARVVRVTSDGNEAGSVEGAGRVEGERSKDNAMTSAGIGAQLMAAMESFLATEVPSAEKALVRKKHQVAALEKHGLSLEDQFQLFVLQSSAQLGVLSGDNNNGRTSSFVDVNSEALPDGRPEFLRYTSATRDGIADMNAKARVGSDVERCVRPGDVASGLGCTESPEFEDKQLEKMNHMYDDVLVQRDVVEAFLQKSNLDANTVAIHEITQDVASFMSIDSILNQETEGDFAEPLSMANPEAYRKWKKRQAARTAAWFSGSMRKLSHGLYPAGSSSKLKELYFGVLELSDKLSNMDSSVQAADKVSWNEVEAKNGFFSRMWTNAKHWFAATAKNFKAAAMAIWESFKAKHDGAEIRCANELESEVKSMANTQGLPSGENLKGKVNKANQDRLVGDVLEKSDRTLGKLATETADDGETLRTQTKLLRTTYNKLREDAQHGNVDMANVNRTAEIMNDVERGACSGKKHELTGMVRKVLQGLKSIWKKMKAAGKAILHAAGQAVKMLIPTIGTRGLGGTVGPAGGGFEEVVDFRNREIGYFTWGAAQVGTSLASASFGGYIGFAVHGYKADWSLEESYITAVYTAYSPGVNWFGLEASVGITFCLDADNSQGVFTPWIPEPQGINGVVVGWSLGAGASLPIDVGVDVGQALYHMFTSECFSSSLRFLGGILNKVCMSCQGTEAAMVSALRAGTWVAGFPVVSDAIFFVIWAINEMMRLWEPEWQQHCSPRSTNLRDDPKYMARIIAQKIEEAHETLLRIHTTSRDLVLVLKEALAEKKHDIEHSSEVKLVAGLSKYECTDAPPMLSLAEPRTAKKFQKLPKEQIKVLVAEMELPALYENCDKYNISGCHGSFTSTEWIRKQVRMAISHVNDDNRFGKCKSDSECTAVLPNSKCKSATYSAAFGFRRGDCRCAPGYCYSGEERGSRGMCKKDVSLQLERRIEVGVEVWLHQRQIELGSFAAQLNSTLER